MYGENSETSYKVPYNPSPKMPPKRDLQMRPQGMVPIISKLIDQCVLSVLHQYEPDGFPFLLSVWFEDGKVHAAIGRRTDAMTFEVDKQAYEEINDTSGDMSCSNTSKVYD